MLNTHGNVCTSSLGGQLKGCWSQLTLILLVAGEMSHVYNLLDVALKRKDGVETRSAKQREAWPGCKREKKGEEIPQK